MRGNEDSRFDCFSDLKTALQSNSGSVDIDPSVADILDLEFSEASVGHAGEMLFDLKFEFTQLEYLLLLCWVLKLMHAVGPLIKESAPCASIVEFPFAERNWNGHLLDPLELLSVDALHSLKKCTLCVLKHNLTRYCGECSMAQPDDVFEVESMRLIHAIDHKLKVKRAVSDA